MWQLSPDDALNFASRLCAVSVLIGLIELALVRRELGVGGLLDWSLIGILNPRVRTRAGSLSRRLFRQVGSRLFTSALAAQAIAAVLLLIWPSALPFVATVFLLQMAVMKRLHLTVDGSDQMCLVVLLACLLGRVGASPIAERAAVTFLAAELALAYFAAGAYKATSDHWQSGGALAMIVHTRMFGQVAASSLLRRHPAVGQAATYAVFCWEFLFFVSIAAPPEGVLVLLSLGIVFHLGCSMIMGLNRFILVFVASYPALIATNGFVRAGLGDAISNYAAAVGFCAGVVALILASAVHG